VKESMQELYVSVDIESNGPYPLDYSMLSFGAAAFYQDKLVDTFSANLETLPGAGQHPDTMAWWATQPEAWAACRKDLQDPAMAICDFVAWVEKLEKENNTKAVFVGYPAGFDFTFMYVYMMKFAGRSPFSFSALDIKSMAFVKLNKPFRYCTKRNFPKTWFGKGRHNHIAVDDAIEQGEMFLRIIRS
jgi:hypothetical protein